MFFHRTSFRAGSTCSQQRASSGPLLLLFEIDVQIRRLLRPEDRTRIAWW